MIVRRIGNGTYSNAFFHALLSEDNDYIYSIFCSHFKVNQ